MSGNNILTDGHSGLIPTLSSYFPDSIQLQSVSEALHYVLCIL